MYPLILNLCQTEKVAVWCFQRFGMEKKYPSFDICNLNANRISNDLFNVDRFHGYVNNNPHIRKMHKHSFYHMAYFTEGEGKHMLDFQTYPIRKGVIYFMRPGQVHNWSFEGKVDGYVLNFSDTFFDQLSIGSHIVDQFSFFGLFSDQQVFELGDPCRGKVDRIFKHILEEAENNAKYNSLMIASLVLQLFVLVAREDAGGQTALNRSNYNSVLVKKFAELIEEQFREIRLPKEYASMLYISSNHLNFICREQMKMSAGEMIRNRVILEAKRMLVNFELSISSIAAELNFFDTSYFVKFFKKYTSLTPEAFRKQYYQKTA